MAYTSQLGMDFWFDFDQYFLFDRPQEVTDAFIAMGGHRRPHQIWEQSRRIGRYPELFVTFMESIKEPTIFIADKQQEIMQRHFGENLDDVRLAFEDFGQGVLFDDRRADTHKVHKMDSGTVGPGMPGIPDEYHTWHGFSAGCIHLGHNADFWLAIDRLIGLTWEIQSVMRPLEDKQDNPRMAEEDLTGLRDKWLAKTLDDLDTEFDEFPFPVGVPPVTN